MRFGGKLGKPINTAPPFFVVSGLVSLSIIMDITTLIAAGNILLLAGLIYIYGESYLKSKAVFAAGLLFFASLFLIQNTVAVYSYFTMSNYYAPDIIPYVLIMNLTQFTGLLILLKISA
jgi:hypothetical protein